jgi:hypothetical protein
VAISFIQVQVDGHWRDLDGAKNVPMETFRSRFFSIWAVCLEDDRQPDGSRCAALTQPHRSPDCNDLGRWGAFGNFFLAGYFETLRPQKKLNIDFSRVCAFQTNALY